MAKKKQETVGLPEMEVPELRARLDELEEKRFRLQFRHASSPLKNPMEIRQAKREIARVKTILWQKTKGTV
jgi:large subunit ribosomal protein L29